MAKLAAIIVAAALLEDRNLLALCLRNDLCGHGNLGGIGHLAVLARDQNIAQRDLVTGFTSQLLDRDLVSGGNPVLLAARAHYCEHGALTHIVFTNRPLCGMPIGSAPAGRSIGRPANMQVARKRGAVSRRPAHCQPAHAAK